MGDIKVKMRYDGSEVRTGVKNDQSLIHGFGNSVNDTLSAGIGKWFAWGAAGAAAMKVIQVAGEQMKQAIDFGGKIADLSKRLDLPPSKVQELGFAAEKAGASIEDIVMATEKMRRSLVDSEDNPKLVQALQRLGVSSTAIVAKDADRALREIGEGLNTIPPSAQRTDDLFQVLGKSSGNLVVALKELKENTEFFQKKSLGVRDEDIATLKRAEEAMTNLNKQFNKDRASFTADIIRMVEAINRVTLKPMYDWAMDSPAKRRIQQEIQETKDKHKGDWENINKWNAEEEAAAKKKLADDAAAKDKKKHDEEEQKEKDKIYEQTQKLRAEQEKVNMTDKERIAYLDEIVRKGENQYETAKKVGKVGINDLEAQRMAEEARLERMNLVKKMDAEAASKNKFQITSDSATGIGNFLGTSLNSKMLSIGEETNRLLSTIEQNTRPKNQPAQQPIFTQ